MSQPPLKSAYYLTLSLLVVIMLTGLKRRQRAIPEFAPPVNSSLEFVRTIGNLFYERGNHALTGKKKIRFFRQYLFTNFGIPAKMFDDPGQPLIDKLSTIGKMKPDLVRSMTKYLQRLEKKPLWSARDLKHADRLINRFKTRAAINKKKSDIF